jgi:hypothetical protein
MEYQEPSDTEKTTRLMAQNVTLHKGLSADTFYNLLAEPTMRIFGADFQTLLPR